MTCVEGSSLWTKSRWCAENEDWMDRMNWLVYWIGYYIGLDGILDWILFWIGWYIGFMMWMLGGVIGWVQ